MSNRYKDTPIVNNGKHYSTFSLPSISKGYGTLDLLSNVRNQEYIWKFGDRCDKIAARFWGDETDWWIIPLCNNLSYMLNVVPGTVIRIPLDPSDVKRKIQS